MVRHIVDRQELLILSRNNSSDVFLQLVVVFGWDEVLSAFDGKHDLDVDLGVGVRHGPTISLLTELGNGFCGGLALQRCRPEWGWGVMSGNVGATTMVTPNGVRAITPEESSVWPNKDPEIVLRS